MSKKTKNKVVIIGSGPGGLTAGMILSYKGYDVHIFEKDSSVGGRNKAIKLGDFVFDTGPTFLMLKYVLDEVFQLVGKNSSDYLEFVKLEPLYRLLFYDKNIKMSSDPEKTSQELEKHFGKKAVKGYQDYLKYESKKFNYLTPCFDKPYGSFFDMMKNPFLKAVPHLELHRTVFESLGKFFDDDDLKLCFTFQSKYLGMSAWECPAAFSMIAYVEHKFGLYHVMGGLNKISEAMAKVIKEQGGKIYLNSPVAKILSEGRVVKGILLTNGEKIDADYVVVNSDFAYSASQLMNTKKYTPKKLMKKKYSCSTFMLYLGLDKKYDIPHHNIVFAKDYRTNVEDIFVNKKLSEDISFYIQNPSITDKTLSPEGKSSLYVLVPVPNLKGDIDWTKEKDSFKEKVLNAISSRTELKDIKQHILVEKVITPIDWQNDYNVYLGATFNLAHNLTQMLYFRPHNKFECYDNVFIVGGGTHPGSGLPTIYKSGIISAKLIIKEKEQ